MNTGHQSRVLWFTVSSREHHVSWFDNYTHPIVIPTLLNVGPDAPTSVAVAGGACGSGVVSMSLP